MATFSVHSFTQQNEKFGKVRRWSLRYASRETNRHTRHNTLHGATMNYYPQSQSTLPNLHSPPVPGPLAKSKEILCTHSARRA